MHDERSASGRGGRALFYIEWSMKYLVKGEGEAVVLLHGWGADKEAMAPLAEALSSEYTVIAPDLYGFGESPITRVMALEDYAEGIIGILNKEGFSRAAVIGHSFGGRVGIRLAVRHREMVSGLVLVDAAGLKPRPGVKRALRRLGNAFGKATHLYKPRGSADYEHSSGYLRGTFLKVIHDFQEGECQLIRCPTLLIWGRKDRDTPPYMARRMRRLIHGSRLVWIRDGGHFSYLDESTRVALLIKEFLAE